MIGVKWKYGGKNATKIELTLEQSQQGVSNDVLVINACVQFREGECTSKVLKNLTGRYYTESWHFGAGLLCKKLVVWCHALLGHTFWATGPELFNNTDLAIMETLNYARLPESVTMSRVFSKVQRRLGEKADLGHVPSWISTVDFEMALEKADLHKGNVFVTLVVYDIVITGNDEFKISEFKKFLSSKLQIKDLDELKYFLGIEVLKNEKGVCMPQRKYCLELLHEYGLLAAKPVDTPLLENIIFFRVDKDEMVGITRTKLFRDQNFLQHDFSDLWGNALNLRPGAESVTMSRRVFSKVQRRLGEKADLGHVPSWISTVDFEMALEKADLV
ncbi:ribonuclease H-like domain-containing protein [Tanacetum coccineum]